MDELKIISFDKKISRSLIHNARNFMIVFILFVVVVVMTTDVRFVSAADLAALGLDFFLLLFCSYLFYVCCADNGTKAGIVSDVYKNALERFKDLKKRIIESSLHTRMREFCTHYIKEDLKETRMLYLSVAGIDYDEYLRKYSNLDGASVDAASELAPAQKTAIKKANKVRPVKLTPDMIMKQGRGSHRRSPLEINPLAKKSVVFSVKFVRMSVLSICMSVIAFDVIAEPTWVVFVTVCLKLVSVTINGFDGYRAGYDNIAVDTVNYLESQSDLMEQAIQYIEANPKTPTND
jgi:hypothetical protein